MGLTSNRSAPAAAKEQEEGVCDRKARGLALSKLARASYPPSGASLYCFSKDKKYFENPRMASSHSNIFSDSRIRSALSRNQSSIKVISHFRMRPITMSVYIGFFVVWTTFLVNGLNGAHAHHHDLQAPLEDETHPRKNLGLAARHSMHPNHHHHHHSKKDAEVLPKLETGEDHPHSLHSKLQPRDFSSFRERRKRHSRRHSKGVEYKQMTSAEEREFQESRKNGASFLENSEDYEVEVKEAQNNSICDYKVVSIPDLEGNRIPADLEHVVCNHAGSRCQEKGFYYCLQTYRIIDVYHGHERSKMKIYAGCVCALFDFPVVQPQSPRLPLDN